MAKGNETPADGRKTLEVGITLGGLSSTFKCSTTSSVAFRLDSVPETAPLHPTHPCTLGRLWTQYHKNPYVSPRDWYPTFHHQWNKSVRGRS